MSTMMGPLIDEKLEADRLFICGLVKTDGPKPSSFSVTTAILLKGFTAYARTLHDAPREDSSPLGLCRGLTGYDQTDIRRGQEGGPRLLEDLDEDVAIEREGEGLVRPVIREPKPDVIVEEHAVHDDRRGSG